MTPPSAAAPAASARSEPVVSSAPAPESPRPAPAAPAPLASELVRPSVTEAATAWVLRHAEGALVLPDGKRDCLVGRPDPATGAIPEINLGPLDLARSLSRRHARLLVDAKGVSLREEPGVANGTWVNGERVAAGATIALKPGDKLRFGAIELELGTA